MGFNFDGLKPSSFAGSTKVYLSQKSEKYFDGLQKDLLKAQQKNRADDAAEIQASIDQFNDMKAIMEEDGQALLDDLKAKGVKIMAGDNDGKPTSRMASIKIEIYEGDKPYTKKDGTQAFPFVNQLSINGYNGTLAVKYGFFKADKDDTEKTGFGGTSIAYTKFSGKGQTPTFYRNTEIVDAKDVPQEFKDAVKVIVAKDMARFYDYEGNNLIFSLRSQIADAIAAKTEKVMVDEYEKKVDKDGNPMYDENGKELVEKTGKQVEKDAEYVFVREYTDKNDIKAQSLVIASRDKDHNSQQVQINLNPNGDGFFINITDFSKDADGNARSRDSEAAPYRVLIKKVEDCAQIENKVIREVVTEFKTDLDKSRQAMKENAEQSK
jgi:hypothetical protein